MKNKRWLKLITAVLILTGITAAYFFNFMYPYRGTVKTFKNSLELNSVLTRKQAADDLTYVINHLKNYHPVYLEEEDTVTKALDAQYHLEINSLNDNVTVLELWRAAERIASILHDGHTKISYYEPGDNYYISDITQMQELGKPIRINGADINSIYETFKKQYSYELETYAEYSFYNNYILNETNLKYCGIDTTEGITFTYQTEDGFVENHYDFVTADKVAGNVVNNDAKWVDYSIDAVNDLAVFTLKACNYNKEYRSVLNDFFTKVKKEGIHNIAVDLRNNGGGNSLVANEFMKYIDISSYRTWAEDYRFGWLLFKNRDMKNKNAKKENPFNGDIYVLTNVRTFSSAMDFAMVIKDNGIGKLVGETSGNLPDSYTDILRFQLPNSKLPMTISYKKMYRIDQTKAKEALTPDYEVPQTEALDKVYELIRID